MKKFLVFIVSILILMTLVACGSSEVVSSSTNPNLKYDLSEYSQDFKEKFESYLGFDITDNKIEEMLKLIIKENDSNVSKIYVELEANDEIVIKSTINKDYIESIPDMIVGCTSFDITPYKDNVGDTVIKIVAKFE